MSMQASYSINVRGVTIHNYIDFANIANCIAVHKDHFEPVGECDLQFYVDLHEGVTLGDVMLALAKLYAMGITSHITTYN